jgi:hypothetical protein
MWVETGGASKRERNFNKSHAHIQQNVGPSCTPFGHNAWEFMATITLVCLQHVVDWVEPRHNHEEIPGEAKTFKLVVHTS